MQAVVGETKIISVPIASGLGTSSGFFLGGFHKIAVQAPLLSSGWLSLLGSFSGDAFKPFHDNAGVQISGFTPGGTGGVFCGSQNAWLLAAEGFGGQLRISAGQQTADRTVLVHLKG